MKNVISALILLLLPIIINQKNQITFIENKNIRIGILPAVGGRVVSLSFNGSGNLLLSDSLKWNESDEKRIRPDPFQDFKTYNGQIVWVGPQDEWWLHQSVNNLRKMQKANWPPDPYLEFGKFNITGLSCNSIEMVGPESPVSGLQLNKKIKIDENEITKFQVCAKNIRKVNVSWDLWLLTRLPAKSVCFIPIDKTKDFRVEGKETEHSEVLPVDTSLGYFSFVPVNPDSGKFNRYGKAFIYPKFPFIAAFTNGFLMVIRFKKFEKCSIHPRQALVEIYNDVNNSSEEGLLELEYHSAYLTLKPGDKMETWETWQVIPYNGLNDRKSQIEFIKINLE